MDYYVLNIFIFIFALDWAYKQVVRKDLKLVGGEINYFQILSKPEAKV